VTAILPVLQQQIKRPFAERLTAGLNLFRHTPRLRGIVAVSLASAAGGAMVFVNTVTLVQSDLGSSERYTAWALAAFGAGSIATALSLPAVLTKFADRTVVLTGSAVLASALSLGALMTPSYTALLMLWSALGIGYSLTLTPIGRVLRRSSNAESRPALFAAHFSVSHASWLVAYPLAGFVSAASGTSVAFAALAFLCLLGFAAAALLWPAHDPESLAHRHPDLPADHPHLNGPEHAHPLVIDSLHPRWPKRPASEL